MKNFIFLALLMMGSLARAETPYPSQLELKSDAELKQAIAASKKMPLVILFTGKNDDGHTWCGPCVRFHPTFEAAAKKFKGRVRFAQVNIHSKGKTSTPKYGIQVFKKNNLNSVPTVMIFQNGKMIGQALDSSARDEETFSPYLEKLLGGQLAEIEATRAAQKAQAECNLATAEAAYQSRMQSCIRP